MPNFTSATPSLDAGLTNWALYGGVNDAWAFRFAATTAANSTSGNVSCQRAANPISVPSVTAPVQGYVCTGADIWTNSAQCLNFLCLEYVLGVCTLSGNVFSGSASMPTKTILGTSVTTASNLAFLVATTTGTATTPTITITYTNQDGTVSQTATMTLPTTPLVTTAFYINPHLAAGDSGIRTVTNISSSVSTGALVLKVFGCLLLGHSNTTLSAGPHSSIEPLITPIFPLTLCAAGEAINIYKAGVSNAQDSIASIILCPETT